METSHEMIWKFMTMHQAPRRGNPKRNTEPLLIAVSSNIIKTNVKAKIDNMQENSKCRLYDDRDEKLNQQIQ